jgi:hypothetical protein
MKIAGHLVDLMVDTGTEHSVVTQPVGPLSQKHATTIRAAGNRAHHPFLVSRQCNFGSHGVRHEFLYLPECLVALIGGGLLCKLRAQITFDSDSMAALKLRGPETKTLILTGTQEEEWSISLREGLLRFLSFPSRFQVYGLKITP